ncbi:MAG: hypothetical protein ABIW82_01600 [Dokdonella sp.]
MPRHAMVTFDAKRHAVAVFSCFALLLLGVCAAQSQFDCSAPSVPALVQPVVRGNGSAGSVTTAQLQQALGSGGAIQLNIGTSTSTSAHRRLRSRRR